MSKQFKRITDRTTEQLKEGIEEAVDMCEEKGLDFFKILTGIDSYFEQRRRKLEMERELARGEDLDR